MSLVWKKVYVIFDGEPGLEAPRFVEVEDENMNSVGGPNFDAKWERDPASIVAGRENLYRLGPFWVREDV